jgi:hypothetical protein
MESRLTRACQGKSNSQGGLNMPDLKEIAEKLGVPPSKLSSLSRAGLLDILCENNRPRPEILAALDSPASAFPPESKYKSSVAEPAPPAPAPAKKYKIKSAVAPTTVAPTTVAPTPVAPTAVAPTPVAPTAVAPTAVAPTAVAPTAVAIPAPAPVVLSPEVKITRDTHYFKPGKDGSAPIQFSRGIVKSDHDIELQRRLLSSLESRVDAYPPETQICYRLLLSLLRDINVEHKHIDLVPFLEIHPKRYNLWLGVVGGRDEIHKLIDKFIPGFEDYMHLPFEELYPLFLNSIKLHYFGPEFVISEKILAAEEFLHDHTSPLGKLGCNRDKFKIPYVSKQDREPSQKNTIAADEPFFTQTSSYPTPPTMLEIPGMICPYTYLSTRQHPSLRDISKFAVTGHPNKVVMFHGTSYPYLRAIKRGISWKYGYGGALGKAFYLTFNPQEALGYACFSCLRVKRLEPKTPNNYAVVLECVIDNAHMILQKNTDATTKWEESDKSTDGFYRNYKDYYQNQIAVREEVIRNMDIVRYHIINISNLSVTSFIYFKEGHEEMSGIHPDSEKLIPCTSMPFSHKKSRVPRKLHVGEYL